MNIPETVLYLVALPLACLITMFLVVWFSMYHPIGVTAYRYYRREPTWAVEKYGWNYIHYGRIVHILEVALFLVLAPILIPKYGLDEIDEDAGFCLFSLCGFFAVILGIAGWITSVIVRHFGGFPNHPEYFIYFPSIGGIPIIIGIGFFSYHVIKYGFIVYKQELLFR